VRYIRHRSPIALVAIVAATMSACGDGATTSSEPTEPPPTDSVASSSPTTPTTAVPDDAARTTDVSTTLVEVDDADDIEIVEVPPPSTDKPTLEPAPTEATVSDPPPDDTIINSSLVQLAIADLRDLVDDAEADVVVLSVEEVTWRDGSIGCPQPDMRYTQALVNGTRIRLSIAGVVFEYHSAENGEPFYCANPDEPLPPGAGGASDF